MKFVKVLSLSILVAFSVAIFSGCTTSGLMGVASRDTSDVSRQLESHEPTHQAAIGNQSIRQVEHRQDLAGKQNVEVRQKTAVQSNQLAQADYIQTAHRQTVARPAASLITLGPNDNLNQIINDADGVVLLDYFADWCGPCRKQGGILHEMKSQAAEQGALIVKVNVDQHPELAKKFSVSSLPTLMLVKDGRVLERQSGIADHKRIASLLSR